MSLTIVRWTFSKLFRIVGVKESTEVFSGYHCAILLFYLCLFGCITKMALHIFPIYDSIFGFNYLAQWTKTSDLQMSYILNIYSYIDQEVLLAGTAKQQAIYISEILYIPKHLSRQVPKSRTAQCVNMEELLYEL